MRIGMLLLSAFPPDIRVEKELATLRGRHEVVVLCQRRGHQSVHDSWRGIEVRRVFSRFQRWWNNWRLMATCRSSSWRREIDRFVKECGLSVLHVHDLPLLGTALEVARDHGIPVVADLHENFPAMLEVGKRVPLRQLTSLGKLVSRMAVSVPRWKEYERDAVSRADLVITVVEEARHRLISIGISPERVYVVGNYAQQGPGPNACPPVGPAVAATDHFRVVYVGGFDPTRDLHTVVSAVSALPEDQYPDLEIELIGGMGRELENLRRHAAAAGVLDRIRISAWLPLEEAERRIGAAHVGLVPHVKSPHTDATIPHKLFQYMWRRVPVIVSNCAPLERIVEETASGVVYTSGSATDLAAAIASVYRDREGAREMGARGHAAVRSRYNWSMAGEVLLSVYDRLGSMR